MFAAPLAKIAVVLGLVAGASIAANAYQLYRAGVVDAEHKAAMEKAVLQGELAAKEAARQTSEKLASDAVEAHARLVRDMEQVAERARQTRVVYRQAAAASPLPAGCAPGEQRTNAVNTALGAAQ